MPSALWLMLTLLAFAPSSSLGRPSEQTSQPLVKTLGQEIGSPSELAWQAWLLVESKGGISSALDSSNILRRITPKSIFIAPELISCPSGYSTDGRGTCRPDPLVLDEAAQKQFFLKRLNAIYGKFGTNKKKPEPPQGPLQINIPISLPAKNPQSEAIPVLVAQQPVVLGNNKSEEAVAVVVYKVENDTKKDESSESFLLGTSNTSAPKKVAEIIIETNDTFTDVVDYKIPVSNSTNRGQQSDKKDSSEDSSPTVVLLLSPTKLPITTEKPKEQDITTEEPQEPMFTVTTTLPTTIVDETGYGTIQTVAPLDVETDVDTTIRTTERAPSTKSSDDYERRDQQMTTITPAPSTLDGETAYTDEDEVEETQTPEQESEDEEEEYEDEFVEDELLKPGEAGMMMSAKNQELIRSKTHMTVPVTATTMMQDTTTIPPTVDVYDAKESTIKPEMTSFTTQTTDAPSTIIVTVPEETTTITTTTSSTTTATPRPQRVTATIKISSKPIPERHTATRRQPTTTTRLTENLTEPPSFFLQRQPPQRPSFTVNDEPHFFKDGSRRDHLPLEFRDQIPRDRTFVRFPESPKPQPQRGFVRFPSDDVNSIHNQDSLKDLSPFQYSSSTKSSVQRWRQQKQKHMLFGFWARMPLVRDLSFYPTTSHGSHNEPIGGLTPPTARRGSIFKNEA